MVLTTNERLGLVALILITFSSELYAAEDAQHIIVKVENGPGWVPWAIFLSAIIAAATAIIAIAKQRITAQKQAAISFLTHLSTDRDYREDEKVFAELVRGNNLLKILSAATSAEMANRIAVSNYLNLFELLGVAIKQHVFDENVCKAMIGDNLVKRWDNAKELIDKIQKDADDEEYFMNFGELAERWRNSPSVSEEHTLKRIWREITQL